MNLNQVPVAVANVEAAIKFYETIGLKLIVKSLPLYARFECPDGDAAFFLHQTDIPNKESNTWIYFEISNLDEYVQKLIEKGFEFEKMPNDKPRLWRASRLKD